MPRFIPFIFILLLVHVIARARIPAHEVYREIQQQLTALKSGIKTEQRKHHKMFQKDYSRSMPVSHSYNEYCLIVILSALLFIIFCLLYYQRYLKKAARKRLQAKNIMLKKILQDKEWLLKEVHHRVKNSLQTVISLLESQAAKLKDEALDAIHESQHRVFAISLIHKKLYEAEHIKTVAMATYIPELVGYIAEMISGTRALSFRYHLDNICLDVSQAVPVGLMINEAVTNAIRYAFAGIDTEGSTISISMGYTLTGHVQMIIADNGKGIPEALLQGGGPGLGLRLLFGLTEDIHGTLMITNKAGTSIMLAFPVYRDSPGH